MVRVTGFNTGRRDHGIVLNKPLPTKVTDLHY